MLFWGEKKNRSSPKQRAPQGDCTGVCTDIDTGVQGQGHRIESRPMGTCGRGTEHWRKLRGSAHGWKSLSWCSFHPHLSSRHRHSTPTTKKEPEGTGHRSRGWAAREVSAAARLPTRHPKYLTLDGRKALAPPGAESGAGGGGRGQSTHQRAGSCQIRVGHPQPG